MDLLLIVALGALAALVLWVRMLGREGRGAGLESLGLRSARQITEDREALEAEDLAQMLEAHNARRRRRGQAEVTVGELEERVAGDLRDLQRRSAAYRVGRDLDELLEVTNARRRVRGLPVRTREDIERESSSAGEL